jgi:hypothetical protein
LWSYGDSNPPGTHLQPVGDTDPEAIMAAYRKIGSGSGVELLARFDIVLPADQAGGPVGA